MPSSRPRPIAKSQRGLTDREAGKLSVPQRHRLPDHRPRPGSTASCCAGGFCWRPRPPTRISTVLINVEVPEAALRGLFRRGHPQGAGERHVPADADPGAARLAALQARTISPASACCRCLPRGGVILTEGPSRRHQQAALCDRLGRARRAGTSPTTARALRATCCRRRRCAISP